MKIQQIIAIIVLLLFLVSCSSSKEVLPEKEIAPKQETKAVITSEPAEISPITENIEPVLIKEEIKPAEKDYLNDFLKETSNKYWFYDVDNGFGGIVYGSKRSSGWIFTSKNVRYFYWTPESKEIYIYFDEMSENILLRMRNSPEYNSRDPKYDYIYGFVKVNISGNYYPTGPVDWMEKYKNKKPTKIEETTQTFRIESRDYTSDLALHFKNDDGTITVLRFDKKYHVPLVVETFSGSIMINKLRYYYDIRWYDESSFLISGDITEDLVNLPKDAEILSVEEAKKYYKEIDKSPLYIDEGINEILKDIFHETNLIRSSSLR